MEQSIGDPSQIVHLQIEHVQVNGFVLVYSAKGGVTALTPRPTCEHQGQTDSPD